MMSNSTDDGLLNTTQLAGCVDDTLVPYVSQIFTDDLDTGTRVLYAFAIASALINLVLYLVRVNRDRPPYDDPSLFKTNLVLVALPMVISISSLCGVIVPRSLVLVGLVQNVYFSFCIARFLSIMVRLLGHRDQLVKKLSGTRMELGRAVPGFGICCAPCCARPAFKSSHLIVLAYCIYQYCILQPLISFLAAVLYDNGNYIEGYVSKYDAYIYLKCLQVASMLLAFYCVTLIRLMVEPILTNYYVGRKFLVLKTAMLMLNLQSLLFGILARADVIKCNMHFSKAAQSSYYLGFALIFEMLPLCCFTVFLAYPFSDKLDRHTPVQRESVSELSKSDVGAATVQQDDDVV
ncbi:organic solute transporter subunit alpha-like [Sycon ciliatum]|uniref:organic solute transporter subunit alpha-like n=1 Tax=Sycon ciliatum TaxID=27933 RepID=UPI0031F6ACE9